MKKLLPLVLLLSACSLTPALQTPQLAPNAWNNTVRAGETDLKNFWAKFKSAELSALQEKAVAQNLDLKAAEARIKQARAAEGAARSSFFPQINGSGDIGRKSGTSSAGLGLDISYELDLFGANRAKAESARANTDAKTYDRDALALVVEAEVTRSYATALALKTKLALAQDNRDNLQKTLKIVRARVEAGAASKIDLERQKTETASAEASVASAKADLATALTGLAVLLGEMPQGFDVKQKSLGDLNVPDIAPGQPSTLLTRRPDMRAAEAGLIGANADIGAARAAFLPSIDLGAGGALAWSPLTTAAAKTLAASASLAAPIFTAGSLEGNLEEKRARLEELTETYRLASLNSFKEVEDALTNARAADAKYRAYARAATSSQKARDMAKAQYELGAIDYASLLDSERSLLSAKTNLVNANLDRFTAAADLYKALGGGWKI